MTSTFGTTKRVARALCICAGLALAAFGFGCGDDDDDDNPMDPVVTGPEGVEASSGVAISSVKSLQTLFGAVGNPLGGAGKLSEMKPFELAMAIARARYDAAAKNDPKFAILEDCSDGGSAESTCVEVAGVSAATLSFTDCVFQENETLVTVDGSIGVGVADTNFCETNEIPETGLVSFGFNDFSVTVRNLEGVQLARFAANFEMEIENEEGGCAGNDASVMMNGTIDADQPGEGVDAELTADDLSLSISSTGDLVCIVTIVADGSLAMVDRKGEREVHVAYDDLELEFTSDEDEVSFTIDGGVHDECLGNISFETIEPLIFEENDSCPTDGTIEVTLSDNSKGRFSFLEDGSITFDYGADGTVDLTLDSCSHDDIRDCEEVAAR